MKLIQNKKGLYMAKGVIIRSDYSNHNTLSIIQKEDGDIVINTYIRDDNDNNVVIATRQGGTRLNHSTEIRKHFRAIIDLLSDSSENENIVRIIE